MVDEDMKRKLSTSPFILIKDIVLTILLLSLSLYKIYSGDLGENFEILAVVTTRFVWTSIIYF